MTEASRIKRCDADILLKLAELAPDGEKDSACPAREDTVFWPFFCTRDLGHTGPHAAYGAQDYPFAVWPMDDGTTLIISGASTVQDTVDEAERKDR